MTVPVMIGGPHSRLPRRELPVAAVWESMSVEELEGLDREVTHRIEDIDVQLGSRKADATARRLPPHEWEEYLVWRRRAVGAKMHLVGYKRELRVAIKQRNRAIHPQTLAAGEYQFAPGDTVGALQAAVGMLSGLLRDGVEFEEDEMTLLGALEAELRRAIDQREVAR